jgi:hypothetical protein
MRYFGQNIKIVDSTDDFKRDIRNSTYAVF